MLSAVVNILNIEMFTYLVTFEKKNEKCYRDTFYKEFAVAFVHSGVLFLAAPQPAKVAAAKLWLPWHSVADCLPGLTT